MGKLAANDLQKMLNCIKPDDRVLVPPMIGYDAGVHRIGDQYLVVAADPCTGVPEDWFGWLLVNYAASDVALSGAKPEFCTITLMGPRPTDPTRFQKIMQQTCEAANEYNIAIVRGHTGMYDSLKDLVGVCTVYGTVKPEHLITSGGAKPGDLILCTKPLGAETITNYCLTHPKNAQQLFGSEKQQTLANQMKLQSCVKEAPALAEIAGVHAMHDTTEGGFVSALNELASASKVGFRVSWENISILPEALILQKHFGLNDDQVLSMSSTGTILGAVAPTSRRKVEKLLQKFDLTASFIGEFTENKERTIVKGSNAADFPSQADDPYTAMMASTS
jgi:hydrogenase expression/formation protein HypE